MARLIANEANFIRQWADYLDSFLKVKSDVIYKKKDVAKALHLDDEDKKWEQGKILLPRLLWLILCVN